MYILADNLRFALKKKKKIRIYSYRACGEKKITALPPLGIRANQGAVSHFARYSFLHEYCCAESDDFLLPLPLPPSRVKLTQSNRCIARKRNLFISEIIFIYIYLEYYSYKVLRLKKFF